MKKVVLLLLFLYVVNICHGGLGSPELNISASVSPNPIKKGTSGVLTVNVNEVGGQDWAKNVVVKAYSPDEGIIITPQVSSPVNISEYGSASYTFNVNVDNTASTGVKTIDLELDYIDTGWLNIGDYPHSKSYVMTFNVIPNYGTLYVESNPSGAEVYIDGYYEGTTPLTIPNILPGTYTVKITKDGYQDYTDDVYIPGGSSKTVSAELTPKFGYLTIYTLSGADVYIDGKYVGHPPIRQYELYEGYHTVKITKDGYNDYYESVYISPGASKILNAKLNSIYASSNELSNDNTANNTSPLMALLFIGLISVGGGAYYITKRKKRQKNMVDDEKTSSYVKTSNLKEHNQDRKLQPKNSTYKSKTTTTRNIKKTTTSSRTTTNNEKSNPKSETKPKSDLKSDLKSANTTQKIANIPDFPKELLYKYIPLQKIGEGGFGKIFKVKRKSYDKIMAIKTPVLDERAKKYLIKEIKAWKNLDHPNIVKMFDAYEEPTPHIEMEYIDGYNLNGKQIRDLEKYPKPTNPKEALKLIKQIAEGLKHAHDKNIIHRDIKPSNILLTQNLTPKITDWGLAKIGAKSSTATTTKGLTLLYSAPEQIDEEEYGKTDKRTDIYQLGLLFYELLTGKLPYEGNSPTQISLKIVNPDKKPLPPSKINPSLSVFDGLFEKLLAKKKEDRFQSIDELLDTLNSLEKITKEKEELKNTLIKTTQKLKTSTDKKEIEKLTRDLINSTTKLALNCAKINDKVGLLEALEILNDYAKSDENKKELNRAISEIEYSIKEGIPLGSDTVNKLNVLLNRIERDWI
jgi:serine/threonine protein kinase